MTERESDTYRRGLTLGLTMAEIFILILFLLLLVLLALYAFNAETERKLQEVEVHLKQTQAKLAETAKQLQKAEENTERLEKGLTALQIKINKLQPIPRDIQHITRVNESLTTQIKVLKEEIATISEELKTAKNQLTQTGQELNTTEEEIKSLTRDNELVSNALADAEEENTIATKLLEKAKAESSRLYTEIAKLRAELSAEKGIDPSCWYKVTIREGERHEKPYYLMDIAVYDKYLEIRTQKAPPGHAIDELGKLAATSYQEEYEKLPLPPLGTTKKVSLQQFAEMTEPIKRMGKNKQIRDYACVFYVKVWDLTGIMEKLPWQKGEDAIKDSFYTYRVKNDPW